MSLESKSKEELVKLCRELQEELDEFKSNPMKRMYVSIKKQLDSFSEQLDKSKIDIMENDKQVAMVVNLAQKSAQIAESMQKLSLTEKEIKEQNKDFSLEMLRKTS